MISGPIVVATDLKARSDRAIDRAMDLGRSLSRDVKVIHVLEGDEASLGEEKLKALVRSVLPEGAPEAEVLLPQGSAPKVIARTAAEQHAAMLVAGVASYNQLIDFVLGTAVDYIVRHATMPVLVVKRRPRFEYRTIIAPTDFSEPSLHAILRTAELFPDAHIELLHAYRVSFEGLQKEAYLRDEVREQNQAELDAFLRSPELAALGPRLSANVAYGNIDMVVMEAVQERSADLVALGTNGASGFRQATIGSNASSLLASLDCDTLMVPGPPV